MDADNLLTTCIYERFHNKFISTLKKSVKITDLIGGYQDYLSRHYKVDMWLGGFAKILDEIFYGHHCGKCIITKGYCDYLKKNVDKEKDFNNVSTVYLKAQGQFIKGGECLDKKCLDEIETLEYVMSEVCKLLSSIDFKERVFFDEYDLFNLTPNEWFENATFNDIFSRLHSFGVDLDVRERCKRLFQQEVFEILVKKQRG